MKLRYIIFLIYLAGAVLAFDRNYYGDELVFSNPCIPKHINFGQPGNDQNAPSWFEATINCTDTGILKTRWGTVLAQNITFYALDSWLGGSSDRLAEIINSNSSEMVQPVNTTKYNKTQADRFALGMEETMFYAIGSPILKADGECVVSSQDFMANATENMIEGYHYMMPYAHVIHGKGKWCFVSPN